jgi:hypothetical protein
MRPDPATARLLDELLAESERYLGEQLPAELPAQVKVTRRSGRNAPVSVRLSPEERRALDVAAAANGVGASTLARELITRGLNQGIPADEGVDGMRAAIAEAIAPLVARIDELARRAG